MIKILCTIFFGIALSTSALSEDWPARPIKLVVPLGAGSAVDAIGRLISKPLSERLGMTVYVENIPGASGILAGQMVAKSAPDGYTLLLASNTVISSNMFLFKKLPYNPVTDFASIGLVANHSAFVISASSHLPVSSLAELISYARANPGKVSYAMDVSSSMAFMIGRSLEARAQIDMQMIPYKSPGQALEDTVAGLTQVFIGPIGPQSGLIQDHKLKALAVSTETRFPGWESIPAVAETLPGFNFEGILFLITPVRTPNDIITRLNGALAEVLRDPALVQRIRQLGFDAPGAETPQAVDKILTADRAMWAELTKQFNIERH